MDLTLRFTDHATGTDQSFEIKTAAAAPAPAQAQADSRRVEVVTSAGARIVSAQAVPIERFTKLDEAGKELPGDATDYAFFIDHLLNLMHPVDEICEPATWKKAQTAASKYRGLGYDDWHVLSPLAGVSLVDYTRFNPAANPIIPNMKAERHWTNTPGPSDPADCAFFVFFSDGNVSVGSQYAFARVRAVRSVVPAGQ